MLIPSLKGAEISHIKQSKKITQLFCYQAGKFQKRGRVKALSIEGTDPGEVVKSSGGALIFKTLIEYSGFTRIGSERSL